MAQLTGAGAEPALSDPCAPEPACPSIEVDALLTDDMAKDLGWLVGQIQHGYLAAASAAVDAVPGGLRGLYVLGASLCGRAPNQIEVARRFGIDRTVMVHLIDQMEDAGLVERRPDPADRRARMIVGTDRGRTAYDEAQARLRLVDEHVLAPLGEDERGAFAEMARRVVAHLVSIDPTQTESACQRATGELDKHAPLA
ncbi:MarR family transcriptional regulator [Pseudofrankia sp. DC12]|uniref:MarR family winged helix-turn-helix transcriptional regulator n=1 Tax=Pseudofrankia sp. DC12 TaxID=683315 RepID=UPI0005F8037F|nr:MarR family transcriptional regulator [Pseudofrankia sp. DC12]